MDIKETFRHKAELEAALSQAVNAVLMDFQKETDLRVLEVDIQGGSIHVYTPVEVTVLLDLGL